MRDILAAVEAIRGYVDGFDFESFRADSRTVDAVIHNLSVAGEAARSLVGEPSPELEELPLRELQGLRNLLIHQYFQVSREILWQTLQEDLPGLEQKLKLVLSRWEEPADTSSSRS